jgi:tetratricopeptide (TPR) repeat protein
MRYPVVATIALLAGVPMSGGRPASLATLAAAHAPHDASDAVALRVRGQALGYNLDREEAFAAFREAMAADPTHPAAYRLTAAAVWIGALFERGAVTAEDYLGHARSESQRPPASRELESAFRTNLDRALALAAERCRESCTADGHFQLGAAYGYQATYAATIDGSLFGSLRAARRAYGEHERALELDPTRKDAGLIVGMYRYGVSELPLAARLVAHIAGLGGGRERGIRMVEDAASYPSEVRTNARFSLIVIYNRERRFDDALRIVGLLQQEYPRNRLLWLEEGSTALRAKQPARARRALEHGLAMLASDARPKAFGERARWGYYYGAALAALREDQAARLTLDAALAEPGRAWVQGRIYTELGRMTARTGRRDAALDEFRHAIRLCSTDDDDDCVREAKTLMRGGKP